MKTLLCVIAAISFLAMPILAEDVKLNINGNMSTGYMDNGTQGNTTPGTFGVPTANVAFGTSFDADTSAVMRLNFDNAGANGLDRAYVKISNVIKKLAKNDMVNPDIYVGLMKINFGEETFSNNTVDNALVQNSIGGLSGVDFGMELRQQALPIDLPVVLGYSLSIMNGAYDGAVSASDDNNQKAYALKVMAQLKSQPLYFSLTQYDSGKFSTGTTVPALSNDLIGAVAAGNYTKGYELDVRYDLLEGAQKFDPTVAPLWSDAKGVFRLAYGAGAKGPMNLISESTSMMLDGIYNVDKAWYVALRYSSMDNVNDDQWTRTTVGGGYRLSDKAILKLDYSMNAEPDTATGGPEVDNDSVALLLCVRW